MFEEGLKTALREICEAVGSPELKDMDFVAASEPLRVDRRLFRLSHAAMAGSFSMA
jgi:hypothetical protein